MSIKRFIPVLIASVLANGCDDNDDEGDLDPVAPPPIPASDVDFIDGLVPHHEVAVRMSDETIARGADREVRMMAEQMKIDQQREIDELMSIRAELAPRFELRTVIDPHSEDDLAAMAGTSGPALDALFLEHMIPHHAGAVSLAHRALPNLTVPALREIAEVTIVNQTREMNEMLDMLER